MSAFVIDRDNRDRWSVHSARPAKSGSRRLASCPVCRFTLRVCAKRPFSADLSMRRPHLLFCFAFLPVATSATAECLKANVEGQNALGQLTVARARDAAGRPEKPYILRLKSNACLA